MLLYYLIFPFFYLLSLLPWRVLYGLSDGIYFLVYYVFGYRKKVVLHNLNIAFPNKSQKEKNRICKDFFHLFIDTFIETIKLISISEKQFKKRIEFNAEPLQKAIASGKSIQLHSGHFLNYEFMNLGIALYKQDCTWLGIYHKLSNPAFNKIILDMRSKFGTTLISTQEFKNRFHIYSQQQYLIGLAADQNPSNPLNAYWTTFFNQKTAFVKGPEKGAKLKDTAILMIYIQPTKRGYYKLEIEALTDTPKETPDGFITNSLASFIEKKVAHYPANYLWSHKRWKHAYDEAKYQQITVG